MKALVEEHRRRCVGRHVEPRMLGVDDGWAGEAIQEKGAAEVVLFEKRQSLLLVPCFMRQAQASEREGCLSSE